MVLSSPTWGILMPATCSRKRDRIAIMNATPELDHQLLDTVERIIRMVVDEEIELIKHGLDVSAVRWKSALQVVTDTDLRIERRLATALRQVLPGGVVGEESGTEDAWALDGHTWIIDPIDGTAEFVNHSTAYSTVVALWSHGALEAGWIYAPSRAQMWRTRRSDGCQLNGYHVLRDSTAIGISITAEEYIRDGLRQIVQHIMAAGVHVFPCTTVSLDYTRIAAGELAGAIYDWDKPWDHAAGVLLCQEAGLQVMHLDGNAYDPARRWTAPLLIATPQCWNILASLANHARAKASLP